ncbi:MAG: DUF72 domain-containing protein [Sphaerochaetaceae bacterium]
MGTILVGTSGYSYTEWIGPVYPPSTKPEAFLGLYVHMFSSVELNFSYYRMPSALQLEHLMGQSGPSLVFSIKANDSLTHTIDPTSWRDSAHTFTDAVETLAASGQLGAVLLQFPYSFHYDVDQRRYLDALLKELAHLPLAVEFRNGQWYNNRVLDSLRSRQVALSSVDLPPLKGLPPVMDVSTSSLAYIRLHGRNSETWWGSDSASRYDYLYSDKELESWVDRIKAIASRASTVLVYFNNHRRGQAVQNAQTLRNMLVKAGLSA